MPVGQAPPAGPAGAVLLGYARLDDATVSRSLFPACLHTCKHSLHNTIKPDGLIPDCASRNSNASTFLFLVTCPNCPLAHGRSVEMAAVQLIDNSHMTLYC
jgi:hypothetical protein